jgi:hypothetical protein
MVRRTSLWLPVLIAGGLGALFCACSGNDQTGLFSPSGGVTGNAGASANAGSPSAAGGRGATGGSSSAAGSTNVAGGSASGGNSNSGGATGAGGAQSGGSANGSAGAGNGGAVSGGAGNNGGSANGGSAGASMAGSNNGGASGAGGAVGTGGASGGAAGNPTCPDLIATAQQQLDAARVCNSSGNAEQCTGSVSATCGCMVPVESDDSPETKAYLATLALIQAKHCIQVCPAIACVVGHAECKSQGGSSSACVAAPLTPVN